VGTGKLQNEFDYEAAGYQKAKYFQAFQDQLGLKLESTKVPTNVIVIDKAEKPSDN
jgi:uncharacterized protein (TIGR03435 family)